VIGPKYSETWFDLRGRTTATMVVAIGPHLLWRLESPFTQVLAANPIGGALGQLLSPIVGDTRKSVSILAAPPSKLMRDEDLGPRYHIERGGPICLHDQCRPSDSSQSVFVSTISLKT
jgi:hypothetical protein